MDNNDIVYISKEDCKKRGLIKLETGGYYKCNTLEKYAINGYLDNEMYDVTTLLATANILYKDYYDGGIYKLLAIDPSKVKVDTCGNPKISKKASRAIDQYSKAIKILPPKIYSIVRRVCCEDKEIIINSTNEYLKTIYLRMLTLGLCLLTKHYQRINRTINICLFYTHGELTNGK